MDEEKIDFTVVFNKKKLNLSFPPSSKIISVKERLSELTGVPTEFQKIVFKGKPSDEQTIKESGITKGAKVMVVGSTMTDVLSIAPTTIEQMKEEDEEHKTPVFKEPLCKQTTHQKVLDKGIPPEVMPAWKNGRSPLPSIPLSGMINKTGRKVRLTFKLEEDQLWLSTKERTEKIAMTSIRAVISEPIEGHEEYHIMAIQMGPTEASRYWIYWVPAQYVDAIRETILGAF